MKKLLFASTALIASAGFAAAQVETTGDGRLGVIYNSAGGLGTTGNQNWAFTNRIRITFTASGETDGGLSFGGSIRADNAGPWWSGPPTVAFNPGGSGGTSGNVYVDGAFGKLSMGDVHGGDKAVITDLHGVGLTGLGFRNELNFVSDGEFGPATLIAAPARVLYEYEMDGFSFAASHSQTGNIRSIGVGAGYSMAGFDVALGYGEARNNNINWRTRDITASAGYGFGDFEVRAVAQQETSTAGGNQTDRTRTLGLSGAANFDMIEVTAFAIQMRSSGWNQTGNAFGLGAAYDLGGGASLEGGITRSRGFGNPQPTTTTADFGVSLSF